MRSTVCFGIAATLFAAVPAAATIEIFSTPGAVQPDENVLFSGPDPVGSTAIGFTNQTNTSVTFLGSETLVTPANGQARIEAADGGLDNLEFLLTDPALGFTEVEFNIFGSRATATSVTLNFTDQFGTVFDRVVEIDSGQNFFSARGIDDQFITNVSFTLNGDVQDLRQVRVGGIVELEDGGIGAGVPEPASWAMMLGGFGLIGFATRRRRAALTVAA